MKNRYKELAGTARRVIRFLDPVRGALDNRIAGLQGELDELLKMG